MASGDFFQSALQNVNPASAALSAVSGFASGGPSSSGDTSGGNADFGTFNIAGITRGGLPTSNSQLLLIGGLLVVVAVVAVALRK